MESLEINQPLLFLSPTRSYLPISHGDLARLAALAAADRQDLFERKAETGRLYSDRLFAVALCQGAALHYVDGKNGINAGDQGL